MGIQLNGTSGTDVISAVDGSLTIDGDISVVDKIIHGGDTNTVIRFPAADTVTVETAGSERLRIDSTGKVGVGANPTAYPGKFVVSGDALICDRDIHSRVANSVANSDRGFKQDIDGVEKLHLYTDNTNNIILEGNGGAEKLRINNGGSVGIGTDGPDSKLHVHNGAFRVTNTAKTNIVEVSTDGNIEVRRTGGSAYIDFSDNTTNDADCRIQHVSDGFEFSTGGQGSRTTKLVINSSGEVSIGAGAGSGKTLTLYGASSSSFRISKSGVLAYDHTFDGSTYTIANNNGSAGIPIVIGTKTGGSESLRIDSNGNVNIGSAAPRKRLDITGPDGRSGASPGNSDTALVIDNDGGNGAIMEFCSDNNAYGRIFFTDTDASNQGQIVYEHGGDAFQFSTAGGERLRIDSGGRLGLSVASAAQLASSKMLTIRPGNDDGIRIIRPGDTNNSPNIHLELTTTTSGSSLRSGGEAYTTKYHTYNNDILFRSYLGGGTGGIIRLMTADGSSGTTRYWQIDEKGKTEHRSRNTSVKTHEFTYTDGAGGGVQTVSLCTLSNYSGSSTAVAEVTYVGSYGLANDYVHSGKWICGIRRASSNSSWSATANETANGGSSSASLDIQWNNGVLQAVTVGAWMGWTVHVTVTTYNFDLTVNV